jgi:phospholipase/lecithinase/hemolysin
MRIGLTAIGYLLSGLVAWICLAAVAVAGPFSSLVVFGDSLSDVGNLAEVTGGLFPGRYYWNDRFSNGTVYTDALSIGLGLGSITPSSDGGNNFAYGGAQTAGSGAANLAPGESPGANSAVPEPATWVLIWMAAGAFSPCWQRRLDR